MRGAISHSMAPAVHLDDDANVLQRGRIVFNGTAEKICDDPRAAGVYLGAHATT